MTGIKKTADVRQQAGTTGGAHALLAPVQHGEEPLPANVSASAATYLILAVILLATAAAYSPVLFNFFNGDDFVHLMWLKDAVKHPELIWRNFHSAWLDGTTARFYRPLISVFMVSDYLLWGANGLGFRLTNLTCHVFSTIFLFFIVRRLPSPGDAAPPGAAQTRWAALSAALFALYPLHPEAVSWITGRVDSVVTVFYLGCFWFYMQWRRGGRPGWLLAAIAFMILGLLSKEMAVTLPVTFVMYEALLARRSGSKTSENQAKNTGATRGARSLLSYSTDVVLPTLPFWGLLAAYFGVRRLALGTFVGGYDDSLFFISDWKLFVHGWAHALRMLLVPINKDFLGAHSILTKTWEVSLAACVLLGAWTILKDRSMRRPVSFAFVWLMLALVPVYKIFAIGDDLQGSRLAYLATAPLCVLIAVAFAGSAGRGPRLLSALSLVLALTISGSAGALLWTNNQSWAAAGREVNAIRAALDNLYRTIPGDPPVLITGLPDHIHGAYACRNALWGMTRYPQLQRDIQNCQPVNGYDPILPFGFLKDSLSKCQDQVRMFRWGGQERGFVAVNIDSVNAASKGLLEGAKPVAKAGSTYERRTDGTIEVRGGSGFRGRPELSFIVPDSPCWAVDFIAVGIELPEPDAYRSASGADILYSNELVKDFDLARRSHAEIKQGVREQRLIFPFRSSTDWSFGGACRELRLLLPDAAHVIVKSIAILPASEIMPAVDFHNSGYLGSKGFIHLSSREPSTELMIDASSVAGASGAILEITRPNLVFESHNSQQASSVLMKTLRLPSRSGRLTLTRDMFPADVMYEVRAWAVDPGGNRIGVAGDHLVVTIDP